MVTIAAHRIQRAQDYREEARLLYWEKIGTMPVLANLYHAMMNCLFALFEIKETGSVSHADIIERFKKEFVRTGVFDRKFAGAVDFAFHITHECNCELMKPPGVEEINRLIPVVREFIERMRTHTKERQ